MQDLRWLSHHNSLQSFHICYAAEAPTALDCCLTVCTMLAMPLCWLCPAVSHATECMLPLQGGTYGGSILGCAAANATLDAIEEDGMLENAQQRGIQLTKVGGAAPPRDLPSADTP